MARSPVPPVLRLGLSVAPGADIGECIIQALEVARTLYVEVEFIHNEVKVYVFPADNYDGVMARWRRTSADRDRMREPGPSRYTVTPMTTELLDDLERFLGEVGSRFVLPKGAWDKLGAAKGIVEILRERL